MEEVNDVMPSTEEISDQFRNALQCANEMLKHLDGRASIGHLMFTASLVFRTIELRCLDEVHAREGVSDPDNPGPIFADMRKIVHRGFLLAEENHVFHKSKDAANEKG